MERAAVSVADQVADGELAKKRSLRGRARPSRLCVRCVCHLLLLFANDAPDARRRRKLEPIELLNGR
jgi:hypothetical protein